MAKTFTQLKTDFLTFSKDANASTLASTLLNYRIKKILNAHDFSFNEDNATELTVASQQAYDLPYNADKITYIKVNDGSYNYCPVEEKIRGRWIVRNRSTSTTSDVPQFYFVNGNEVEFYPIPTSSDNTITFYFQKIFKDFGASDYDTGTASVTAGATAITGAGTTFTADMVGRYIQFDDDGYWYEITAFTSTTAITIGREAKKTISGGDYTIAELVPFPDGYEDVALYGALSDYFEQKELPSQAQEWERMYENRLAELIRRDGKTSNKLFTQEVLEYINPNDYPTDLT